MICVHTGFAGTKSKDNSQFDPNRQGQDFKKKVFVYLIFYDLISSFTLDSVFMFYASN